MSLTSLCLRVLPRQLRYCDWLKLGASLLVIAGTPLSVSGQVVLDGKFGTKGPLAGPNYSIDAAKGLTRGNNLFHSFAQFDLSAGETANFHGPANIRNILSRVTGGTPSSIDGTIRSDIPGANFFFLNPKGVLFGPNAAIDVSGSFAATSANYLKLANGARFVAAIDADDSVLTTDPVVAFGFLEGADGQVQMGGSAKSGAGQSLSLVGSGVSVVDGAHLESLNGHIYLTGVSTAGEVPFASADALASKPQSRKLAGAGSDNISIRGGRLVVDNARVSATSANGELNVAMSDSLAIVNGGQITSTSSAEASGGNINIDAPSILIDARDGENPTRVATETISESALGTGGDLTIRSESLEIRGGGEISVSTFGPGAAGQLNIDTSTLRLQGSDMPMLPTQISANAAPGIGTESGAGGGITIQANSVTVENFAGIMAFTAGDADAGAIHIESGEIFLANGAVTTSTAGVGKGGEIDLTAQRITLDGPFASITAVTTALNQATPAGAGGVITIEAGSLTLLNDSGISANTYGDGAGGNISIAAESLVLDTASSQPGSIPGISAASNPSFFEEGGGGKGGDISLRVGALALRNGMSVSTSSATSGDGGNIHVQADTISLDGQSSIQAASTESGKAGTLQVQSSGDIVLSRKSFISTSALNSSGGDIRVEAGRELRLLDGQITAQAGPGGGGNITVIAPDLVYLLDSTFTAQAVGDGGNLSVDSDFFIINRSSLVSKSTSENGGNITITSDYFFQSGSVIDASAPFGLPGTVTVTAPEVDLSGSLIALPGNLLGLEMELRPDCGVRLSGNISSFIVLGRGGLPLDPGGFIPSGAGSPSHEEQ